MAKLVLNDVASLQSETSALATLADNNARTEAALEKTLSRDGTGPNQMEAVLDMNSQRLINLAPPEASTDAARLVDIAEALSVDQVLVPALVSGRLLTNNGTTLSWIAPTSIPGIGNLNSANNLSDLASVSTARTNLGLGTAATQNVGSAGSGVPLLQNVNTWPVLQQFNAQVTMNGGLFMSGAFDYRLTNTPPTLANDSVGYRGSPVSIQNINYTLVLGDSGKTIRHTDATPYAWTIPPESAVLYPVGTIIAFVNDGSGTITITRGVGVVLRLAGSPTTQEVSLAANGMASALKTDANTWRISGTGIS